MQRPLRTIVRALVALVVVGAAAWVLRPQPLRVDMAPTTRGALTSTVTAEGKVRVKDLFVVTAPVDGELARLTLKAGDVVPAAAVVAQLRPVASRPLDPRSRSEADAAVIAARADVQRAEAAVQEAIAALAHAESVSQTSTRLAGQGVIASKDAEHSGHEVEIRRQAQRVTESALAQARAALARAEAAASVGTSNRSPAATTVRSPVAGRVLRVVRESSGPVRAGEPLLEIGNVGALEIAADFLTTDAVAIAPGAAATILDWGGPAPLAARVRYVEPGGFTKVSALGLEEQRVPVVLDLTEPPPVVFGNEFHVKAAVAVWSGVNVLTAPSTALFRNGNAWAVFVVRNGRAKLTPVTVGRADATRTVVERGLTDGDVVITQPADSIVDGTRVSRLPSSILTTDQ
jgi:HlyD family secretion protein